MRCKKLNSRIFEAKGQEWVLCEATLLDYLETLPDTFYDFNIQRRIVKNTYLDNLYDSILAGEPFLPITLTADSSLQIADEIEIGGNQFEILDGLQRTFRLWVPFKIHQIISRNNIKDERSFSNYLKSYEPELAEAFSACGFVTTKYKRDMIERTLFDNGLAQTLVEAYSNYTVLFYVWKGLSERALVEKMLILNAGQKPVKSTHQFELLFLHFFNGISEAETGVRLVRAKDSDYYQVTRGNREPKTFSMASVIVGLKSYVDGREQRIAPANMISADEYDKDYNDLSAFFNHNFLSEYIRLLGDFDARNSEDLEFKRWFSKDTTISGIMGAIGNNIEEVDRGNITNLSERLSKLSSESFLLDLFEYEYKRLSSVNSNVGNAVRKAIFNFTTDLLRGVFPSWEEAFSVKNRE